MAGFEIIEDANNYESIVGRQNDDEVILLVPEPIRIRGVGHLTLCVNIVLFSFSMQMLRCTLLFMCVETEFADISDSRIGCYKLSSMLSIEQSRGATV